MPTFAIPHPREFYIDGAWSTPDSTATIDVTNSSDESVIATVSLAAESDLNHAIAAARRAFDDGPWPRLTPDRRGEYLRAIAAKCMDREEELAAIWAAESGIVYTGAKGRVGPLMSSMLTLYADLADSFAFEEPHTPAGGGVGTLVREPVGVVGAIIPWNGPAALITYKVPPALLAGCTVVLKMSPEAPCSGNVFAEICDEVGLPPGVINVVTADREVSEQLVRSPDVDKITFTGSTAAGRRIGALCGERVARCTLELGGKSPALVLDDYDLETAARALVLNCSAITGQVCHNLTRVIVGRDRHDAMVEALSEVARSLVVGDAFDPGTQMGPLATAQHRERVERYIARGQDEGATLASGGRRPPHLDRGYFIEPTIFGNVDNRSTIAQEEIFGPVLSVIAAEDEADAVRLANDSIYGLNASVFTNDIDRARALARQLKSGTVGHNASRTDFSIAFGGFKQSGIGREGGTEGLLPFLETKTVILEG